MQLKQIKFIHQGLVGIALLLLSGSVYVHFFCCEDLIQEQITSVKRELPSLAFALPKGTYASLGSSILKLNTAPIRLNLPDLRAHLTYYGHNGRPDASLDTPKMHFGLVGNKTVVAAEPNDRLYLVYDKKLSTACKYTFSPNNQETMIWFTAQPDGSEVIISLAMRDDEGHIISESDKNGTFALPEKEMTRNTNLGAWELGKWRVDGSLLARQKARWVGVDRFLENHGGDEFAEISAKQRIDFGEEDESYSVYVQAGDCLAWDRDRWNWITPGPNSVDKPLLLIKKVDDRVMNMEVWDIAGKGKITLNLIRSPESFAPQQLVSDFRFVGARTKTQVVFQVHQERIILRPHDWLLKTEDGWRKLKTPQEIDDYVNRKLVGALFIFEEIIKKDDKPFLIGTIFSPNRTEMHSIEVAMMSSNSQPSTVSQEDDEEEDEEDEDVPEKNKINKIPVVAPNANT